MEIISNVIETTISSFDFAFCIVVNILTYIIIKLIDTNKKKRLTTWKKRIILLIVMIITSIVYYIAGSDIKLILNSFILAPVFWSWIMKPVCKAFDIDYKEIDVFK